MKKLFRPKKRTNERRCLRLIMQEILIFVCFDNQIATVARHIAKVHWRHIAEGLRPAFDIYIRRIDKIAIYV